MEITLNTVPAISAIAALSSVNDATHRLLFPLCADENIVHCIRRYFHNALGGMRRIGRMPIDDNNACADLDDKEVYNITEGEITREQLLRFFIKSKMNRAAVVAIYRKDGTYKGKITYQELLNLSAF